MYRVYVPTTLMKSAPVETTDMVNTLFFPVYLNLLGRRFFYILSEQKLFWF